MCSFVLLNSSGYLFDIGISSVSDDEECRGCSKLNAFKSN